MTWTTNPAPDDNDPVIMLAILREATRYMNRGGRLEAVEYFLQNREYMDEEGNRLPVVELHELERVVWRAFRHLETAGLVEDLDDGTYTITPRGIEVLKDHPHGIDDTVLMGFESFKRYVSTKTDKGEFHPRRELTAYRRGWSASVAGTSFRSNPFDEETLEHQAWANGWLFAQDEKAGYFQESIQL